MLIITIFSLIMVMILPPATSLARSFTSIDLIDRAYRNTGIDYNEALNYKVMAILRPEGLPAPYRSMVPAKSATPVLLEARSNRHLLSPENRRLLARERNDSLIGWYGSDVVPELLSFMSPMRRFRIHYTTDNKYGDAVPTTDNNANNIPDYVEKFADILDHVWSKEVDEMGYNAPPSDGTSGGDCLLDVYLADLPGYYGLTQIDTGMAASTVYMIFENDFLDGFPTNSNPGGQQEGDMKVTAAHEFFHTIQFQMSEDITLNGWWMEASATWMEDYVYPEVNDYVNYIADWFSHPDLPLDTYNGRFEYGTAIWIKHMTERYGSRFVYDVWGRIKDGDSALSGVEKELIDRGTTTLKDELKELRVANVTLTYDDGQIYQAWDGTNPGDVGYAGSYTNFSTTVNISNVNVEMLAAKYYSFSAPGGSGSLNITLNGNGNIGVMVIGIRSADSGYDVTEMLTDGNNDGEITVDGFSSGGPYDRVVVIPLNYSTTTQGSFSLTASYNTSAPNSPSSMEVMPPAASIVTGDGSLGKQQYFIILREGGGLQVLKSGTIWADDSSAAIDNNGLLTASNAVTTTITASLGGLLSNPVALVIGNPVQITPGTPRDCNIGHNSDNRCFIATAAFGSPLHPYVGILREFRDSYLLTNQPGRYIVSLYYSYSPPISEKIARYDILKSIVKIWLIPVIIFSGFMVKTTMMEKIMSGITLMIIGLFMQSLRAKRNDTLK